jgi:hypothetical protein
MSSCAFDYEQTRELIRAPIDVRFKLLAIVPTIAGAAVAFLGSPRAAAGAWCRRRPPGGRGDRSAFRDAVMLEVQRIGSEAKQTGETLTTGGS